MKYFLFLCSVFLFASCNVSDPPVDQEQDLNQSLQKGKQAKVDVCHLDDEGNYKKININENALPAHLGHGDGLPGEDVPDKEGYKFNEDCQCEYKNACPGVPTVEYAGLTYNTVQVGDQCWMKENLNIGNMIDVIANATNDGNIEKFCYDNNEANCETYGGLYQWNEAMQYVSTEGTQGICPDGWHIPKMNEFETLKAFVNSDGNALKAIGQGGGTNESGFSALLAGSRYYPNEEFYYLDDYTYFWSSTAYGNYARYMTLYDDENYLYFAYNSKSFGFSVRCIKD